MNTLAKSFGTLLGLLPLIATSFSAQAQKRSMVINTSQQINASKAEAFAVLRELERFPEWSPFLVADPEQKYHVTGQNGEIGSAFHWEGVAEKSLGQQTLVVMQDNDYLRMECDIQKPFKGQPVFEYELTENAEGVIVTQHFSIALSGMDYFMIKLFGVRKEMEATNKLGLERLKALLEGKEPIANN